MSNLTAKYLCKVFQYL